MFEKHNLLFALAAALVCTTSSGLVGAESENEEQISRLENIVRARSEVFQEEEGRSLLNSGQCSCISYDGLVVQNDNAKASCAGLVPNTTAAKACLQGSGLNSDSVFYKTAYLGFPLYWCRFILNPLLGLGDSICAQPSIGVAWSDIGPCLNASVLVHPNDPLSANATIYKGVWAGVNSSVTVCGPPTNGPTRNPTRLPSKNPSRNPTVPSASPSRNPSRNPVPRTRSPTRNPTNPSKSPTRNPSRNPTKKPSRNPTIFAPTRNPTKLPTNPTSRPSRNPTNPTAKRTRSPTRNPTNPSRSPSRNPTVSLPPTPPTVPPVSAPQLGALNIELTDQVPGIYGAGETTIVGVASTMVACLFVFIAA